VIRIVHLITDLSTGGAQSMLLRLLERTDRDRFAPSVVYLTGDPAMAARVAALDVDVHHVPMRPAMPNPLRAWQLWRLLRRERPQILQTWLYHADLLGLATGRLAGVPHIVWNIRCAQTDERYLTGRNGMVVRALARLSALPDAVVVNSHAGQTAHEALGYHPRRWEVLPNGFDTQLFSPHPEAHDALCRELGVPARSKLVGLVARYDPLKDHETFLRAAAICAQADSEAHFVLVGAGVDDANAALRGLSDQLGLTDRLHMLGERSDVTRLTAAFDIAVCSSRGEGFPNVVGEAMACAVPAVVTDVGDCAFLLGDAGDVVAPGEPAALASGLTRQLALSDDERRALGARGRQRIVAGFSIEAAAERYARFYDGLCHDARVLA